MCTTWCGVSRRWVTQSAMVLLAPTNVQEEVTGSRGLYATCGVLMSFPTLIGISAKKVRGSVFGRNIATSIAAVQHRQPQHITMFGPFRLTNPLSGGLLWCDSLYFSAYPLAQLLVFALTFSVLTKLQEDTMAPLQTPEVQTSRAFTTRRLRGRHTRYRTTTYGAEHEEGGTLEDGDAD